MVAAWEALGGPAAPSRGARVTTERDWCSAQTAGSALAPGQGDGDADRARQLLRLLPDPRVLTNLEAWIRRRLRSYLWRQWGNGHNRFKELCDAAAYRSSEQPSPPGSPTGVLAAVSNPTSSAASRPAQPPLQTSSYSFCPTLCSGIGLTQPNRHSHVTRMPGGVGGVEARDIPLSPINTHANVSNSISSCFAVRTA